MRAPTRRFVGSAAVPLTAFLALGMVAAAGCSSTKKSPSALASNGTANPAAATATPARTAATGGGLSGTWSGHYGGAFQGTFSLNWQQSGADLNGTIHLSTPPVTMSINGTLTGRSIQFGTVGGVGITYSGSVSGSSMAGDYTVGAGHGGSGGPWSASKTS